MKSVKLGKIEKNLWIRWIFKW